MLMDSADEVVALRKTIEKQIAQQQEANALTRQLIDAVTALAQELADAREATEHEIIQEKPHAK
jgi:hypothetical protein